VSEARAERLAGLARERKLDALLVTNLLNVRYVTGFTGTNGLCLVGPGERLFFTDFRYVTQAAEQVDGFDREQGKRDLLGDVAARMSGRVGFDDADLSVSRHRRLEELVDEGVELVPAGGLVEELRAVKDVGELAALRAAAELADSAIAELAGAGLAGRTEREVAVWLERAMIDRGAGGVSFPPIVAAGAHGALPHAEPRDVEIPRGTLVVVDWGCVLDGYCSDCTRTFATGEPTAEMAEVYELVRSVQAEARDAVRAGADCRELDGLARRQIEEAGHGERFGHGLGHGVGLDVHERPRLSPLADDGPLKAGNVVTVEPGVYVPGEFGVRVEDLVAVTESGCEPLSGFTKELTTL
jgi:Xaa-Pro aminopeptidase